MAQPPARTFDLELGVAPHGDLLQLRVLDSPAGPLREPVPAPNPLANPQVESLLESARQPQVNSSELRKLGRLLSQSLTPDPIATRLRSSLRDFADPDTPLRFRLLLTVPQLLATLPWELTYDDEQDSFLAVDPRLRVMRLVRSTTPAAWGSLARELGVLMALSRTEPVANPELETIAERLSADLESLPTLRAQLMTTTTTVSGLIEQLRGEVNILHLYTHSGYEHSQPVIYLQDELGRSNPVAPGTLAGVLRASSVPLAIVCDSGRADQPRTAEETQALLNYAAQLVEAGVPAVLAVPSAMGERAAQVFWREFYTRITGGEPLDAALSAGRNVLWLRREPAPSWYLPALFSAPDESALWPFGRQNTNTAAQQKWINSLP